MHFPTLRAPVMLGAFVSTVPVRARSCNSFTNSLEKWDTVKHRNACAPARRSRLLVTSQLAVTDILPSTEEKMEKTIDSVRSSFNTIRTGRASTTILDRVMVMYYDVETPLNQLASLSVSGSSTLTVEPYDKSCIADVERALMQSDIGLTPNSDGSIIRLSVPQLNQERRKELVKKTKSLAEEGRVALRNIRRDAIDKLKKLEKDSDLGKDESKTMQDKVQKVTDSYVKKIDTALKEKEKDIMTV